MKTNRKAGYIVGAILVLIGIYMIVAYNSLVKKEVNVQTKWAEVQATYQRRLDLIPSLVSTVKGVSGFEEETLVKITEARSKAGNIGLTTTEATADNIRQQQQAQDSLAIATNRMIVRIEDYPALKGTAAYSGLQTQLEGTERRIKIARNDFNAAVNGYNQSVRSFPGNLVAGLFGFKAKEGFQAAAGADKAVEIKFR